MEDRIKEESGIFEESEKKYVAPDVKKPLDVAALVLGIVTVVAATFSPLISCVCGIIGLAFAIKHRGEKRTTVALILRVIGDIASVVSNVIAAHKVMEALQNTA